MKYYENILELVGNTPLVKLNNLTKGYKATVLAKLESMNPGGSVKDRIGKSMIEAAEKEGKLKPGGTIVEGTSGNTGIGIALAAALKGYKCIFVMTEKVSAEKRNYLKALGAEIVIQPMTAKYGEPDHYVSVAKKIHEELPNSIFAYQYSNPANPMAHYLTTGPEIWKDTEGKITHFVSGIGTGGTISGTGKFLKEKNPNVKVIGSDPYGSIFKSYKETGIAPEPIPYLIEGIGQDVIPQNVAFEYIDEIRNVNDKDSVTYARLLTKEEGIFCGASTGTIAYTALDVAKDLGKDDIVVFIVCDTGERYLSKYHSDEWVRSKRLLSKDHLTVSTVYQTKKMNGIPRLVSVRSDSRIYEALELMDKYNITTLPVINDSVSIGSIKESEIMEKVIHDRSTSSRAVSDLMDKPLPVHDAQEDFRRVLDSLQDHNAVLVSQYGIINGILTRYDVLDFV